jgi:hypothetical protein
VADYFNLLSACTAPTSTHFLIRQNRSPARFEPESSHGEFSRFPAP